MRKAKELLGGQALIEGVMMKGPDSVACAVYNPDKELILKKEKFKPLSKKYPFLGWIFIRGFVNLLEMMVLGFKMLTYSAEIAMPEESAKQSKYEMPLSIFVAVIFFVALFILLPASGFEQLKKHVDNTVLLNVLEGLIRITIFFLYLLLINLSKDIRRVFGFHGAEHATVFAYEAGEELTVKNVKKYSVLHPRCGTSFLLVVLIVSIVVFTFLGRPELWQRVLYKLLLLPLVSGIAYEFIRLVNRLPRPLLLFFLWPGLLLQKLTTRRPDNDMIKAAIEALKQVKRV